jgi:hypothetical protein
MTSLVTTVDVTASPVSLADWDATWQASTLRARVSGGLGGGVVPPLLAENLPTDVQGVHAVPAHWHSALYGALVLRKIGSQFTATDCFAALQAEGITWDQTHVATALLGFLAHLKKVGHLAFDVDSSGRPAGPLRVVADLISDRPTTTGSAPTQPLPRPRPATGREDVPVTGGATPPPISSRAPDPNRAVAAQPVWQPRTAAESTWARQATAVLTKTGLADPTIQALLAIARPGTEVTVTPVTPA